MASKTWKELAKALRTGTLSSVLAVFAVAHAHSVSWDIEVIDDNGDVGQNVSIFLDERDSITVSYHNDFTNDLILALQTATGWDAQLVDSTGTIGRPASLAFDSAGNISVSFYDVVETSLRFAGWV